MKLKVVIYGIIGLLCCIGCTNEENITPRNEGFKLRFEFPQGVNEWDKIAQEIQEEYGVYLIYKGLDSSHLRRTWTSTASSYAGESLTDEQALLHIKFIKEQVLSYIPSDLTKGVLPLYYYLVYNYRTSTTASTALLNSSNGVDYWVSSIFSKGTDLTDDQYRERRYMMLKCILDKLCEQGNIVATNDFHRNFDYATGLISYPYDDKNYYKSRGFVGSATDSWSGTHFSSPYQIYSIPPLLNFKAFICLGMRYTPEELEAAFPAKSYPKIHSNRNYIVKYMKEMYGINLEAICQGTKL